jgi:hypothetical protein
MSIVIFSAMPGSLPMRRSKSNSPETRNGSTTVSITSVWRMRRRSNSPPRISRPFSRTSRYGSDGPSSQSSVASAESLPTSPAGLTNSARKSGIRSFVSTTLIVASPRRNWNG